MAHSKNKVILMHNFGKKGSFGDIIDVKPGYAKNFLIPNGLAKHANKVNLEKFESLRKDALEKAEQARKEALILSDRINSLSIIVNANAGQDGRIFGSISSKNILSALVELDSSLDIDKNKIFINIPIKYVGNHVIKFNLNPDVVLTKTISVVNVNTSSNSQLENEEDDNLLGYDYSGGSKINSGDKKYDFLDKEEGSSML